MAVDWKIVDGVSLKASAFAFVGDLEKPHTWKLPYRFPKRRQERNHVKNAIERFGDVDIPAVQRASVWMKIAMRAAAHGISVASEPPPQTNKPVKKPVTVRQERLSAETLAQKQARAEADYKVEAFLKSIGFWSDERDENGRSVY